MFKWFKLFGRQYVGFWVLGLVLFALQEAPYMVMPLLDLSGNPMMDMREASPVLNFFEKMLGTLCIAAMCFIVQEKATVFSIGSGIRKTGFVLAVLILLAYYVGWALYFSGHQTLWVILAFIVALPPLYYAAIGLWRENWALGALGIIFGVIHLIHVYGNFKV